MGQGRRSGQGWGRGGEPAGRQGRPEARWLARKTTQRSRKETNCFFYFIFSF
jgi:hypothetical protein